MIRQDYMIKIHKANPVHLEKSCESCKKICESL